MDIEKLNTDELFKALPSMINMNGNFYHFKLIKGAKRIIVRYQTNVDEGSRCLGSTSRSGDTLKDALKSMVGWLIEFKYYEKESDNILLDMIHNSLNREL